MYQTVKSHIKKIFPRFFIKARDSKDQLKIEFNTLRQVGITRLLKQFISSKDKWKFELPVQNILRFNVPIHSLEALCKEGHGFKEGGHTYYFEPNVVLKLPIKAIFKYIPNNAGIKILKRQGAIDVPFPAPDKTCVSHALLAPSHKDLLLVHGIFFNLKMGPRLYDLLEIEFQNGDVHVAYVLEHIDGAIAIQKDCEEFIQKLQQLESSHLIKLINWNGYGDMDFCCPDCNGNLLYDKKSQSLKYVDLQNFSLADYTTYLKKIALEALEASHFGQKSYLMGGEYLYQEIPGLNLPAKRSPAERFHVFKKLLTNANLTLQNKFIIDVGCNIGLMGAQYLKEGAAWLHGFDMPEVVPYTEKVLLSIGCTRFSLSGLLLGPEVSLLEHFPLEIRNSLQSCVISYLAIRGHISWVKELAQIPWDFMLYEGHQEEDEQMSHQFINELSHIKACEIISEGWISDANSTPRYIAIIKAVVKE